MVSSTQYLSGIFIRYLKRYWQEPTLFYLMSLDHMTSVEACDWLIRRGARPVVGGHSPVLPGGRFFGPKALKGSNKKLVGRENVMAEFWKKSGLKKLLVKD